MKFSRNQFITFTCTIASPAVFTSTDHELYAGDTVWLETTGALPTGLSVDTTYYVIINGLTANTFQLSETNPLLTDLTVTPITTTGTQSGTHSFVKTNRAKLTPRYEDCR